MTRAVRPTEIRLRDNVYVTVSQNQGSETVTLYAPPNHRDPKIDASGLGPHQSWFEPGDGSAEYKGMPVEAVRAYCRLHGGVAEAGEMALALLKKLPSAAAEPVPAPEQPSAPAVEEAAAPRPFSLLGEPWWPRGPRPRLTPGHRINLSWKGLLRASNSTT